VTRRFLQLLMMAAFNLPYGPPLELRRRAAAHSSIYLRVSFICYRYHWPSKELGLASKAAFEGVMADMPLSALYSSYMIVDDGDALIILIFTVYASHAIPHNCDFR
jgi:hypothetical protein